MLLSHLDLLLLLLEIHQGKGSVGASNGPWKGDGHEIVQEGIHGPESKGSRTNASQGRTAHAITHQLSDEDNEEEESPDEDDTIKKRNLLMHCLLTVRFEVIAVTSR